MGKYEFKDDNLGKEVEVAKERRVKILGASKGLHFNKETHTYTLDGIVLISGTQIVKKFIRPFERYYISSMVAKKNAKIGRALTTDIEVRKYWDAKGERAASLGTSGHAFCQMYMMDSNGVKAYHRIEENALKLLNKLKESFNVLNLEVNRGNRKYKIGYSIDIELQHKETGNIYLGDYKFSETFTNEQYKEAKGEFPQYLLTPFRAIDLRESVFDKGKIQLNLYKKLYELDTGNKVAGMLLFHIDGVGNHNWYGDSGFKTYVVPELNKEINMILKPHENLEFDILRDT